MADCNDSDKELDESKVRISGECAITKVIDDVIEQVERQKLETPNDLNSSTANHQLMDVTLNSAKSTDSPNERRKRHRSGSRKFRVRHRKRKWKPYCKLSWEERKKLEERDSRRAYRSREKMSASGLTLAPYNTTQFLMEDHNLQEPDYESITHHHTKDCHNYDSGEDFYSSPDDEEEFLHQQFSETYDSFHDDIINNMSKYELVKELMRLEDEIEGVEKSLKECREKNLSPQYPCLDVDAELAKIQVFQDEIAKLNQENFVLEQKNEILQSRVERVKSI